MPRCVRNFWIELEVDGRKTKIETGPRSKAGGFDLIIGLREAGSISEQAVRIIGQVTPNGMLQVVAHVGEKPPKLLLETKA